LKNKQRNSKTFLLQRHGGHATCNNQLPAMFFKKQCSSLPNEKNFFCLCLSTFKARKRGGQRMARRPRVGAAHNLKKTALDAVLMLTKFILNCAFAAAFTKTTPHPLD
jgi:hypothetical protein